MAKRAERRHHEERVKDKFRRVVRQIIALPDWPWGDRKRREFIEHTVPRMAHHPRHQCQMCREDEKTERERREREIMKKAPIVEDE